MARLSIDRFSKVSFSAKMTVPMRIWACGHATGKSALAGEINRRLNGIRTVALSIYREQSKIREGVSAGNVRNLLLGMASGQETLLAYFDTLNRRFQEHVGVNREESTADPFDGYEPERSKQKRKYLTSEELERLMHTPLRNPKPYLIRELFLFSCFTGIPYEDMCQLSKKDIEVAGDGKLFPMYSNSEMNAGLKRIAELFGIGIRLVFHVARHTYATEITLSHGVPLENLPSFHGIKFSVCTL